MRKPPAIFLAVLALALLASACSEPDPIPPPPWLTPDKVPDGTVGAGTELPADTAGTKTIEATGEGVTEEAAKKDALRNALERGAGVIIRNESLTVDWQLARDVILAETRGTIEKFDVLSLKRDRGIFKAKVRAVVSTKLIAKDLSILHYLSNHQRIACALVDFAGDRPAETTLVQSSFETALLAKKFNVVDRSQVDAIKARDRLSSFKDPALAQKLGKRWGCDILITGKGYTNFAKVEKVYGVEQTFYAATIEAKAVLVSSGQVVAAENVTIRRGGRSAASAEKRALSGAGEEIARSLIKKIVLHLRKASIDEAAIELLVKGVEFKEIVALEEALKKLKGMQKVVQRSYHEGVATLDCRFKGDARTLAVLLGKVQAPRLKIVSVETNRIEASSQ